MGQFDTAPGPDTNAPEPAATMTAAEQQAKDFIESFRALVAAKLPKFELPHPLTSPLVRRHRNVPASFATTVADMVALNPDMQSFKQYDIDENKADQQQIEAYLAVYQELLTVVKGVHYFVATKQAKTNAASFQMQAFTQALAKDPAFGHLIPALDTIKQARRAKAKQKKQTPTGPSQNGQPQNGQPQNGGPVLTH
jgi:hypothetical protein